MPSVASAGRLPWPIANWLARVQAAVPATREHAALPPAPLTATFDAASLPQTTTDPLAHQDATVYDSFNTGLPSVSQNAHTSTAERTTLDQYDNSGQQTGQRVTIG